MLCVLSCSVVSDSWWPLWIVALQVPLSMGFFQARILEWVFPPRGEHLNPGIEPASRYPGSPALSDKFFTTEPSRKNYFIFIQMFSMWDFYVIFTINKLFTWKQCLLVKVYFQNYRRIPLVNNWFFPLIHGLNLADKTKNEWQLCDKNEIDYPL